MDDEGNNKAYQAYQVIGWLLHELSLFETIEGQRALDYFSDEDRYEDDFLPWPRDKITETAKEP